MEIKNIKKGELGKTKFVDEKMGKIKPTVKSDIKFTVDKSNTDYDKQPMKHSY